MTHIYEQLFLHCPYVRVREFLRETLENVTFLQVTPQTCVLVKCEPGNDPLHFDEAWNVYWTAPPDGEYPDFAGELSVHADESYRAILELSGDYVPPSRQAGRTFDLANGARAASATAKALLAQIGSSIEARCRAGETAKPARIS